MAFARKVDRIARNCRECGLLFFPDMHEVRRGPDRGWWCSKRCANKKRAVLTAPVMERRCAKCDTVKPRSGFPNDKRRPGGIGYMCRQCQSEIDTRYREKRRLYSQRTRAAAAAARTTMPRRASRRDDNHAEIVAAFEKLGWSVLDLANVGAGVPDLIIGDHAHGVHLVEIKNKKTGYGRRGLSRSQRDWAARWMAGNVHVVTSLDDVVTLTRELTGGDRADGKPPQRVVVNSAEEAAKL
jgi:hypothetical protein